MALELRRLEIEDSSLYVVLTHDVDWPRHGPPRRHVLERLQRFDVQDRYLFFYGENLYDCIWSIVDCEERVYAKSTFFFRPSYDDGSTADLYSDVMHELDRQGWEVGLHANCGSSVEAIAREREVLERLSGASIVSMRVHYLGIDPRVLPHLASAGIRVDSSICLSRYGPSEDSSGALAIDGVVELPITVMDTYVFSYWGIGDPDRALSHVVRAVENAFSRGARLVTILWHSNTLRMAGGRQYPRILERLWEIDCVRFIRARDVLSVARLSSDEG